MAVQQENPVRISVVLDMDAVAWHLMIIICSGGFSPSQLVVHLEHAIQYNRLKCLEPV